MKILSTYIKGLFVIEPDYFLDERGYFSETYKKDIFENNFPKVKFCQDNESKSSLGTLRGLHYQLPPFDQTKLVRVVKGIVLDVAVDLRKNSSTFGKHFSIELDDQNKKQLLIPKGFAHGFLVLSDEAIFSYKVDNYYNPKSERGIIYNDSKIGVDWKLNNQDLRLSEKDISLPEFKEAEYFNY